MSLRVTWRSKGCIGPSICLLLVTLVGCNTAAVVALLVTTQFLYGFYYGGSFMNSLDLGIHYAGSISGIGLTIVNSMGIFSAQVAGLLTDGEQSTKQWNKVFYIAMGVIIAPFVIFMLFGSTEEQEWNKQERDEEKSKEILLNKLGHLKCGSPSYSSASPKGPSPCFCTHTSTSIKARGDSPQDSVGQWEGTQQE
uniref:(California timema) hypothetical protein n=1 Tax=Timema californicum TaxID=61474 RepID=A0A7R9IY93_TIMCA|nr:unnamed protein product [Timema californicum]